jgi:hypothetical protein
MTWILAAAVVVLAVAVLDLRGRFHNLCEDRRHDVKRVSELGRQMQALRMQRVNPLGRPVVRWDHTWTGDLEARIAETNRQN